MNLFIHTSMSLLTPIQIPMTNVRMMMIDSMIQITFPP